MTKRKEPTMRRDNDMETYASSKGKPLTTEEHIKNLNRVAQVQAGLPSSDECRLAADHMAELQARVKELDNEVVNATRITSISQDRYQKAEARVKELEAVIARQNPKTADMSNLRLGMTVWIMFMGTAFPHSVVRIETNRDTGEVEVGWLDTNCGYGMNKSSECYSTREAAEEAAKKGTQQ